MKYSLAFSAIATLLTGVSAHTWVEQITNVDTNGSYYGAPGYIRHYIARDDPAFADGQLSWLSPQNKQGESRIRIDDTDMLCHKNQQDPNTSTQWPSLKTAAGNAVAIRYLENGHVSQPQNQPGKTEGAGKVYVYGTTNPKPAEKLANVLQWTTDGNLDDGRLLTVQPYDDGRCYQVNPNAAISVQRQAQFPNGVPGQPGSTHELWCQNNIKIPEDATGTMTVYWVWQWPTAPNVDPGLPSGKDEIYTSCMDFDLVQNQGLLRSAVGGKSLGAFEDVTPALPNFQQRAQDEQLPQTAIFYNPGSPIGSSSASPSNQPQPTAAPSAPNAPIPSTMVTSASPAAPAAPSFVSQPGMVYVTETSTELVTMTVYDDGPTSTPAASSPTGSVPNGSAPNGSAPNGSAPNGGRGNGGRNRNSAKFRQ